MSCCLLIGQTHSTKVLIVLLMFVFKGDCKSMFSRAANQFYNCWSTCVKVSWGVDRAAKAYFVDNLACYGNFFCGCGEAVEIRIIACVAAEDV